MSGIQSRILFLGTSKSGKSVKAQEVVGHGCLHGIDFLVGDHMTQFCAADWPRERIKIERTTNLEKLCRIACRRATEGSPVVVVFDEIDLACNSQRPISEKSALYEVLHMGRNYRPPVAGGGDVLWPHTYPVGIWGMARLPGSLRPDLKYTVDRVYLGRTNGRKNVKFIADMIDDEAQADALRSYLPGEWIYRDLQ